MPWRECDEDTAHETLQGLVGLTIKKVEKDPQCDVGLLLTLNNGQQLAVGFSSIEGRIRVWEHK